MKLTAVTFELPGERFTFRPLRSGGATSLFAPCVSLGDIRRFGWWMSGAFREYLWLGDLQYRHLSTLMANSTSLADQLRLAADKSKGIKFTEPIYMEAEDIPHRTGGKAPLGTRRGSPGSSPGPRSGDDFPDDAGTNGPVVMNIADMTVAQRYPGSVSLEYMKRSAREGPARHDSINRSDEQEKISDANFEVRRGRFRQRGQPARHFSSHQYRSGGKGGAYTGRENRGVLGGMIRG